jgi:hypothetical protein
MFLAIAKLLKVLVARDGMEPPTPAFSGPLTESRKWFEKRRISHPIKNSCSSALGSRGLIWAIYGRSVFAYCSCSYTTHTERQSATSHK